MANIEFYKKNLGISNVDELCKALTDTLIETNYTYDFFVNWDKAVNNRDIFKYELALLKSIKGSSSPETDFTSLLEKYPEVVKVIPVLLACREGILKVIDSIEDLLQHKTFNFNKSHYKPSEIKEIVRFARKTGLLKVLCEMDSATDYLLGVEVGLDTNARKNRSGIFLEKMVTELLENLASRNSNLTFVAQKTFSYVEARHGIEIPPTLKDRKFDYVVINKGVATNIEVNFYGGTGSKPSEIVNSYINRGEVLSSAGWKFVWLTDGQGWKRMQRPFHLGVNGISYVINAHFLRQGLLERIIYNY